MYPKITDLTEMLNNFIVTTILLFVPFFYNKTRDCWSDLSIFCPCPVACLVKHTVAAGKVKCTLLQALSLCTGRMAHRGSRDIALLFLDHGTRRGWGVRITPQPLFTPGKDPVPIVQEAGWASGPVWKGAENLVPTGIRSPDRPARSQSHSNCRYRIKYAFKSF